MLRRIITAVLLRSRKVFLREKVYLAAWEMRPQSRLYQCFFSPYCVTKGMKKSGQETHCFLLAFFCTLYGSYPISVCWLILFYE